MNAYPLILEPIYKERIWGGQKLKSFFGKDLPHGKKITELQQCYGVINLKGNKAI